MLTRLKKCDKKLIKLCTICHLISMTAEQLQLLIGQLNKKQDVMCIQKSNILHIVLCRLAVFQHDCGANIKGIVQMFFIYCSINHKLRKKESQLYLTSKTTVLYTMMSKTEQYI